MVKITEGPITQSLAQSRALPAAPEITRHVVSGTTQNLLSRACLSARHIKVLKTLLGVPIATEMGEIPHPCLVEKLKKFSLKKKLEGGGS